MPPQTPQNCFECHGEMVKIFPIHSYDFNKEGFVPRYCNDCGLCSDVEEIIPETDILAKLSNRFKKKILKIVCNHGKTFDYSAFNVLFGSVKDQDIYSPSELIESLIETANNNNILLDSDFVTNTIYIHVSVTAF